MTIAQLERRVTAEVDEVNLLLDPRSELRGVGGRLVRIFDIAAERVEQLLMMGYERDV